MTYHPDRKTTKGDVGTYSTVTTRLAVGTDTHVLTADSAQSEGVKWAVTANSTDDDAVHDNVSGEISLITEKDPTVAADLILIEDSADSNNKKRVQLGNIPVPAIADLIVSQTTVTVVGPTTIANVVTICDATINAVTVTLPGSSVAGRTYIVKRINDGQEGVNAVTVARDAQTIDGAASDKGVLENESFTFVADASSNWWIV